MKKPKAAQFGKVEVSSSPRPPVPSLYFNLPTPSFCSSQPLQLCFSPNEGDALPFITVMCAALTGLDPDLKLKMDKHRAAAPALGTHGVGKVADSVVTGDITCATYFLKTHTRFDLTLPVVGGSDPKEQAKVGEWVEYASKCKGAIEVRCALVAQNEMHNLIANWLLTKP